jgi:hypothetical protein
LLYFFQTNEKEQVDEEARNILKEKIIDPAHQRQKKIGTMKSLKSNKKSSENFGCNHQ